VSSVSLWFSSFDNEIEFPTQDTEVNFLQYGRFPDL